MDTQPDITPVPKGLQTLRRPTAEITFMEDLDWDDSTVKIPRQQLMPLNFEDETFGVWKIRE